MNDSGGYDKEDKAARAYDLAALKYWNATATTNFPVNTFPHSSSHFIRLWVLYLGHSLLIHSYDFRLRITRKN